MSENETKSSPIASLATPIAIVIAGVIIAGAVIYTNNFSNGSKVAGTTTTATTAQASKYQKFIDLSGEIGLNADKFSQCMDKFDTSEIKDDMSEAAQYGVQGTPAFFIGKSGNGSINGVRISGAYPFDTFKGVIDGLNEGNDQKIIDAIGPDQDGNLAASLAEISQQVSFGDDPVEGDNNAPITIVEFSDYECPFCQRHFTTTYMQLKAEYIDTGKVKEIFRDFPLQSIHDPVATQAAVAANCAREQGGDQAYFKYHDEYFTRTKSNGEGL